MISRRASPAGLLPWLAAVLAIVLYGQTIAVAASTLVAIACFQPLRRRVEAVVDRRFDRGRVDAEATASAFADRLRDVVEINALTSDLTRTMDHSVKPTAQGPWLRGAAE